MYNKKIEDEKELLYIKYATTRIIILNHKALAVVIARNVIDAIDITNAFTPFSCYPQLKLRIYYLNLIIHIVANLEYVKS